ncbi:MAG: hypothetical protein ACLUFU_05770 [Bacilli bacterium]
MKKKKVPIMEIGIIILLIVITAAIMNYPIDLRSLEFWLFIMIIFFETIVIILISYKGHKKKKKKKIDKKYLEKANQNKLIIIFCISIILVIVLSITKNILVNIYEAKNIYPEKTESYNYEVLEDLKVLYIPSHSVYIGTYWHELIKFNSPKNSNQLKKEIENILNSDKFSKIETEDGTYYYNSEYDYTIIGYDVIEGLVINTFNYVLCDGYCTD